MLTWSASLDESKLISKIARRSVNLGIHIRQVDASMDVEATHCNGNALKLEELLNTDDVNFTHDLVGIKYHINRTNGQLVNCFRPRFSA